MSQNIRIKLFYVDAGQGQGLCLTLANGEIVVVAEDLKAVYSYITLDFIQNHFPEEMASASVRYCGGSNRCITEGLNKVLRLMGEVSVLVLDQEVKLFYVPFRLMDGKTVPRVSCRWLLLNKKSVDREGICSLLVENAGVCK